MKISTVRNKILTCHHENLDRSWQNLDLSLWKSPLVIIRINFNFWPRQCSTGSLVYCCSGFEFSVWEKNIIFSSLSHICHFFVRISTCFGKFFINLFPFVEISLCLPLKIKEDLVLCLSKHLEQKLLKAMKR